MMDWRSTGKGVEAGKATDSIASRPEIALVFQTDLEAATQHSIRAANQRLNGAKVGQLGVLGQHFLSDIAVARKAKIVKPLQRIPSAPPAEVDMGGGPHAGIRTRSNGSQL